MKTRLFSSLCILIIILTSSLFAASEESTDYFAVFMEGKKVGHAVFSRSVKDSKVTSSQNVVLTISRGDIELTAAMTETCIETPDGKPLGFESVQDLSFMKMTAVGTVEPNGMMTVKAGTAGNFTTKKMPWPEGALMQEGLSLLEKDKGLKKGTTYSLKIFSPSNLMALDAQVTIGDRENVDLLGRIVPLTAIQTKLNVPQAGEMTTSDYVDDQLEIQKSVMTIAGMKVELIACEKEFALSPPETFELVTRLFLPSPKPLRNLGTVRSITYYLSPIKDSSSTEGLSDEKTRLTALKKIPSNDNQTVKAGQNGQVIVTVTPVKAPKGVKFPYEGKDEKILSALQPTRYVQSDNKKIIELAKKAVGDANDAADAVKKIESFVAKYITNKDMSVGYASALEVAESRQGDCSEFAVLTAALCRAVGIPAQVVTGFAYVEEWGGSSNIFGGHAWTQAYIGDKWVGLDSAFKGTGRGGYDAGHIALAAGNGDPEDFFSLITTFGLFNIDKLEIGTK